MMKIMPILSRFQKVRNWTNQQSKSYGIGQKTNSAPLLLTVFLLSSFFFSDSGYFSPRRMSWVLKFCMGFSVKKKLRFEMENKWEPPSLGDF
jgi:hypothetical protein